MNQELKKYTTIDGQLFKLFIEASLNWLRTNQQIVNSLNVFPVPDGDTGTNMVLTLQAAYNEIQNSGDIKISKIAHSIAQGALMGARGNSGVILSQLWRGFSRALDNKDSMNVSDFSKALIEAKNTAYKGVVRPVEGTILTVAKDVSIASEEIIGKTEDIETFLDHIVKAADVSVQNTPELLPILKQAGVVDSGGKGLYFILEGFLKFLRGESLETATTKLVQPIALMNGGEMEEIEPGQDYEVIIDFRPENPLNLDVFYADLTEMGTSIQVGEGDGIYRMHIHVPTENRYLPIDYTMNLGTITKVYIENLIDQMEQIDADKQKNLNLISLEPGQIAVVAVSPGFGLSQIFASLGAAAIVQGGQTMNPSTEEILHSFENLPTDKVIILPNNKNIFLAAQSAKEATVKHVEVLPCKTIPQGLSAMLRLDPDGDLEDIIDEMRESIHEVDTGEITVATRSVEINGVDVKEGEVIAIFNSELISSSSSIEKACFEILNRVDSEERERLTLFYGSDITRQDVNQIVDHIREKYPQFEIEIHEGGQPHYQFIISIE
ncbi:MAG TPA: DAK2 domain-containing protein [Anaerolineaceae bacterium]|nr:DAK2 domain-containing protein [Anaerolineaceae bacterium]